MYVLSPTVEETPHQAKSAPTKRLPGDVADLEEQYHRSLQAAMKLFEAGTAKLEEGKRLKIRAIKLRAVRRAMEDAKGEIGEVERQHEKTGK